MTEKTNLITLAVLDAALGSLVSKAKGTPVEDDVNNLKAKLEQFRTQPAVVPYKDLSGDLNQAKEVIADLKTQLASALDVKADKSGKPVITLGNVKYVVNHGSFPNAVQDIVDNPELAKDILKITGQNAITKLK